MNTREQTTAYFNSRDDAEAAMLKLQQLGIPDTDMELHHGSGTTGARGDEPTFMDRVKEFFTGEPHRGNEGSYESGALLTVYGADPEIIGVLRESNGYIQSGEDRSDTGVAAGDAGADLSPAGAAPRSAGASTQGM